MFYLKKYFLWITQLRMLVFIVNFGNRQFEHTLNNFKHLMLNFLIKDFSNHVIFLIKNFQTEKLLKYAPRGPFYHPLPLLALPLLPLPPLLPYPTYPAQIILTSLFTYLASPTSSASPPIFPHTGKISKDVHTPDQNYKGLCPELRNPPNELKSTLQQCIMRYLS